MLFQPNAPRNRAAHAERIGGQLGALLDATLGASCCARSTLKVTGGTWSYQILLVQCTHLVIWL